VTGYTPPCNAYKVICLHRYLSREMNHLPGGGWSMRAPALPEVLTSGSHRECACHICVNLSLANDHGIHQVSLDPNPEGVTVSSSLSDVIEFLEVERMF
jgi:hypothetical protein